MSTTFGRYLLTRRVGVGGMAEIWKAKAQGPAGFEKILAIKKVLPELVEEAGFVEMFVAEAKLAAALVHPNIVQVFDFGQVGENEYFIAMEYVAGANLAQLIKRLGDRKSKMPLELALHVVLEACKGLGCAHTHTTSAGDPLNIVHRDISPQNILVSFGGEVKVTDFGIAKVATALSRTGAGMVRGKLAYMSPEQARTMPLDHRSDLFSLGVVLYELATGSRLFYGKSGSEIFAMVLDFKVPNRETFAGLPEEVQDILVTSLQPSPGDRYDGARSMEAALARALGPDGSVEARHALAAITQRLFPEERRLETESSSLQPAPDAQAAAQTTTSPSGSFAPPAPGATVAQAKTDLEAVKAAVDQIRAELMRVQAGTTGEVQAGRHAPGKPAGVRGRLADLGVIELIQTLSMGGKTARLELKHPASGDGLLHFEEGRIVAADTRSRHGEDAFYEMATWREGDFVILGGEIASSKNISVSNDFLVMESFRRQDEANAGIPQDGKASRVEVRSGGAPKAVPKANESGLTLNKPAPVKMPAPAPAPPRKSRAIYLIGGVVLLGLAAVGVMQLVLPHSDVTPTSTPVAATPTAIESPIVTKTAVAAVSPVRTATATPRTVIATPIPTAKPVVKGAGILSVNAKPWVQVFVDNQLVAKETPLRRLSIPSGRHTLRFVKPSSNFSKELVIDMPVDGEKSYFVDVKAGTVRQE